MKLEWRNKLDYANKALRLIRARADDDASRFVNANITSDSYFKVRPFVVGRECGIALTFVKSPLYTRSTGKDGITRRVRRAERTVVLCTDRGTDALRVYYGGKDAFTPFETEPRDWSKYASFAVGQDGIKGRREWTRAAAQVLRFLFTSAKPTGTPRNN